MEAQHSPGSTATAFTSEEILAALQDNEIGDARLLIKGMKGRFVFDGKRERFFRFEGGFWKIDIEREYIACASRLLREAYGSEAIRQKNISVNPGIDEDTKKNALDTLQRLNRRKKNINTVNRLKNVIILSRSGLNTLSIIGDEWNKDPWLLQAQDQVIDLRTGESISGLPEDYINKSAPTEWKGLNEPAPIFDKFIFSTFDDNAELVEYIQRITGMALIGESTEDELYIFWGEGRNGKTTLLETLKFVLGAGMAKPLSSAMLMNSKFAGSSGPNPELLDLQGRRITWVSETKAGQYIDAEKVKILTGGDTISSRYNFGNDMIDFDPTHTLFMLTNHKPRIPASETALWDRIRLIPFLVRFVNNPTKANERQKIPDLQKQLYEEASGILAWLVRGCLAAQKTGLAPPDIVMDSSNEYKNEEDITYHFINECCITGENYKVQMDPLYNAFSEWYKKTYGENSKAPSKVHLAKLLRPKFKYEKVRHTWYYGLALIDDTHDQPAPPWQP